MNKHLADPEHIENMLALYAMGGLDENEMRQVEAYVARHETAAAKLADLQATATLLPYATPPAKPSSALRETLLERVQADAAVRFPQQYTAAPPRKRTQPLLHTPPVSWWEWLFGRPSLALGSLGLAVMALLWAATLATQLRQTEQLNRSLEQQLAVLAATNQSVQEANSTLGINLSNLEADNAQLAAVNSQLQEDLTAANSATETLQQEVATLQTNLASLGEANQGLQEALAQQQAIANLVNSPDTQSITLPGTESSPEAQGQLLYNPQSDLALLVVADMTPLTNGEVYQVLLIRDNGHDTAETFSVSTDGNNVLLVHSAAPLNTFTAVGVSIEPAGGSPQRTGDIILLGNLSN